MRILRRTKAKPRLRLSSAAPPLVALPERYRYILRRARVPLHSTLQHLLPIVHIGLDALPSGRCDPGHRTASIPSQSSSTARLIARKSSDLSSRPSMCTVQSSPGRSSTQTSYTLARACTRYVAAYLLEVCAMILQVMTVLVSIGGYSRKTREL